MWGGYVVCLRGDKELAHTSVQDDIPIFVNATQLSFVLAVYYCIHLLLLKTKRFLTYVHITILTLCVFIVDSLSRERNVNLSCRILSNLLIYRES